MALRRRKRNTALAGVAATLTLILASQAAVVFDRGQMERRILRAVSEGSAGVWTAEAASWTWTGRVTLRGLRGDLADPAGVFARVRCPEVRFRQGVSGLLTGRLSDLEVTAAGGATLELLGDDALYRLGAWAEAATPVVRVAVPEAAVLWSQDRGSLRFVLQRTEIVRTGADWGGRGALIGDGFSEGALSFEGNGRRLNLRLGNLALSPQGSPWLPPELAIQASRLGLSGPADMELDARGSLGWKAAMRLFDASLRPPTLPLPFDHVRGALVLDRSGIHASVLDGVVFGGDVRLAEGGMALENTLRLDCTLDGCRIGDELLGLLQGGAADAWGRLSPDGRVRGSRIKIQAAAGGSPAIQAAGRADGVRLRGLWGASFQGDWSVDPGVLSLSNVACALAGWTLEGVGGQLRWSPTEGWVSDGLAGNFLGGRFTASVRVPAAAGDLPEVRFQATSVPVAGLLSESSALGLAEVDVESSTAGTIVEVRLRKGGHPGVGSPLDRVWQRISGEPFRWVESGLVRIRIDPDGGRRVDRVLMVLPRRYLAGRGENGPEGTTEIRLYEGPRPGMRSVLMGGDDPAAQAAAAACRRIVLRGPLRSMQVVEMEPAVPGDEAFRAAFLEGEAPGFFGWE